MIETLPPGLRRAVSPYTGIVRSVEECLAATADPALFQAACEVGTERGLLGASLDHLSGIGGSGRTRGEAAAAAVGEAIERYSATYVPRDRIVVARARELAGAVEPERFALFSDRQCSLPGFPYRRFTAATPVAWVEGWELPGGDPAWLPAELVFLGPMPVQAGRPVGYATSSGLSCRESAEDALLSGLLEVLERDAFMITWANRLSLPQIDTSRSPQIEPALQAPFERTGLRYAAIDLSVFHALPVVLGVVRAPAGFAGAIGVGAAAASTIERAWWKALSEAFASRSAGAKLALLTPDDAARGGEVLTFEDHIRRYAGHEHAPATAFLDASPARTPAAAVPELEGTGPGEWIEALCRRVEAAGATAYAVDVTSPDVAPLGLTVMRVVAPELCRLDVAHTARFLGGRRLYEAAAALGLRDGILREVDVNPDPHPFP
jgi:ribosomal protein S12 methylthiotransferase accessory factor